MSLLLSIVLAFSAIPFTVFSSNFNSGVDITDYMDDRLNLSEYTIDDILSMYSQKFYSLVSDFERIYDSFNSYMENGGSYDVSTYGHGGFRGAVSPYWTSGEIDKDGKWTEAGSHEYITMTACNIIINDKGFFAKKESDAVVIALLISLSSLLPDKDENENIFAGHFYDPNTQKNYIGKTDNTARTNATKHYNSAVHYAKNGNMQSAYEYIGRCLHYLQDACEPHHASNIISLGYTSHSVFESKDNSNIDKYFKNFNSISAGMYVAAKNTTVSELAHISAGIAYKHKNSVDNLLNQSKWDDVAEECMQMASERSAMVLYKFGLYSYVPFYKN